MFKVHQYFLFSVLLSIFLGYFFNVGIISYSPFIIFMLLVIIIELFYRPTMKISYWLSVIAWLPYSLWAGFNYIRHPLNDNILTLNFLIIIIIPIIVLSIIRIKQLKKRDEHVYLLHRFIFIFIFLLGEFIICIGQISTYLFGIGFAISEEYQQLFMISGTFVNSNDLASIVLIVSFIFIGLEKYLKTSDKNYVWFLIFTLLLITNLRSALVLTAVFYIISRDINLKNILLTLFIGACFFILIEQFSTFDTGVFSRIFTRVTSISNLIFDGIGGDGSISNRIKSYLYFMHNLNRIGLGSGDISNYFEFSRDATFHTELMFKSPHSLIVELGYWLGWFGLLSFGIAIVLLTQYSTRKIQLICLIVVSTMISSSVLGNIVFFLFFIISFFDLANINVADKIELNNNKYGISK